MSEADDEPLDDEPLVKFFERAAVERATRTLADAVARFLDCVDVLDHTADDYDDELEEKVYAPLRALLCKHAGHDPIPDQCGKPDHDYCVRCYEITPGEAQRGH